MLSTSTELEGRRVLSGPIGERTKWIIITGPPSSGKTTFLRALAALGHRTSHDVSRTHIEASLGDRKSKHEVRSNEARLQKEILWKMLALEGSLPKQDTVFLDYGLPDNLAFWELGNLKLTGEVWRAALRFRYRHIFLFQALPFEEDHVRVESDAYQAQLADKLEMIYGALGYQFTRVPPVPVSDRLSLVLNTLRSFDDPSK